MFCKKCGNELTGDEKFCKNCGEMVQVNNENMNQVDNVKIENNESTANENTSSVINSNESAMNVNTNDNMNNLGSNLSNGASVLLSTNEPKNKSNLPFIIIFVVLGIIIVGLIVFIAINLIPKDDDTSNENTPPIKEENNDQSSDNTDDNVDKDDNETIKKDVITVTNYNYEKLEGYDYRLKNNKLYVKNKTSDFVAVLSNSSNSYSIAITKKEEIKQKFIDAGYTINNYYTKSFGTTEYVVFEVTYTGNKLIIFYGKHPDGTAVVGSIQINNTYTYEKALEDISKVINSSSRLENTNDNDSSGSFDVDIPDIVE